MSLKQEIGFRRHKPVEAGMFYIDCNDFVEKLYVSVIELKNRIIAHLKNKAAVYVDQWVFE